MAMPSGEKQPKSFSLFSVVSFPNLECQSQMEDMVGLCLTAEECNERTGVKSGNCASGFGICCITTITAATATINGNVTYITNEGFPTAVGTANPAVAVNQAIMFAGGEDIKQIRLDFQTGVFEQPIAGSGLCTNKDTVTLTQGGKLTGFPTSGLCGTLTGQHIYIDHSTGTTSSSLTIATSTTTFSRTWKILVRFLDDNLAPSGCRQYFTGASGVITSLNDLSGTVAGVMLGDLDYKACVRLEKGNRCVAYRQNGLAATPSTFNLADPNTDGAEVGTACTKDII